MKTQEMLQKEEALERRIESYWDARSPKFSAVRRRELEGSDAARWQKFIASHLPEKKPLRVLDVGTGAGFPGLPLKIFAPSIELTLMDSLQKRVKFLQAVVAELGLSGVHCVHARAEEAARMTAYREQFDIVCARAVARLPILAEYAMPFVRRGGHFLALKGKAFAEEANEAKKAIKALGGKSVTIRAVKLPGLDDKRAVIVVEKAMPTPKAYPRKAGTPSKSPIL